MAVVGAVVAVIGLIASHQAAGKARRAANLGADSIMLETAENIKQAKRSQAQTLGIAKASIAASGVKFDASKINDVKFTEGGTRKVEYETREYNEDTEMYETVTKTRDEEISQGVQVSGEEKGSSTFNYLREMKKVFAEDLGWMSKQGRERARVARQGGQVAYAQAQANMTSQAAGAYQQAYSWWSQRDTSGQGTTTYGGGSAGAYDSFSGE